VSLQSLQFLAQLLISETGACRGHAPTDDVTDKDLAFDRALCQTADDVFLQRQVQDDDRRGSQQ
jgi:hypothetical protein